MKRRSLLAAALAIAASRGAEIAFARRAASQTPSTSGTSLQVALVGDCVFTQGLLRDDPKLQHVLPFLRDADVTIANFEGTLADPGSWAALIDPGGVPVCGGLNVRGDATVPADLVWLGIDMVGTANNHAMDWGPDGLRATTRKLGAAGIQHCGTGEDLTQARKPAYYNSKEGRIALISCASTYWPGALASLGNPAVPGRPGVNPVRFHAVGSVADTSAIETAATQVDPRDLVDICATIIEARAEADVVLVSCHSHEDGGDRTIPPRFLSELAHGCVDAGAQAFFSHGPHILRGIEIYRDAPILYGLGAFIFRARDLRQLPEELYENCGLTRRDPLELFARTSRDWDNDVAFWESLIAQLEFRNGRVAAVNLIPTHTRHDSPETYGMPELATGAHGNLILQRMRQLCDAFGTRLQIRAGVAKLHMAEHS